MERVAGDSASVQLDDKTKTRLRVRAAHHRRSMECSPDYFLCVCNAAAVPDTLSCTSRCVRPKFKFTAWRTDWLFGTYQEHPVCGQMNLRKFWRSGSRFAPSDLSRFLGKHELRVLKPNHPRTG